MKKTLITCYILANTFIATSHAHDPSEHTAKMEEPNCVAMNGMNHSSMHNDDTVMMAMRKKCTDKQPTIQLPGMGGDSSINFDKKKERKPKRHSSVHAH